MTNLNQAYRQRNLARFRLNLRSAPEEVLFHTADRQFQFIQEGATLILLTYTRKTGTIENEARFEDIDLYDEEIISTWIEEELRDYTDPVHIAVFFTEREFGGPEEGGWYYDKSERVSKAKEYPNRKAAEAVLSRGQALLDHWHPENARDTSSVLSQGRYEIRTFDYPEVESTRPHYE